jgi:RNA polymerase sigma-70 factor (ECF subfamily)
VRCAASSDAPEARSDAAGAPEALALVVRARGGDAGAFRGLFRRFAPMVHAILVTRVAPADADDLVQEVFVDAWRALGDLDDAGRFGGWVAAIARRRAARARERARPEPIELSAELAVPGAERDGGARESGRVALAALAALPEPYRETLAMRLVEGMTGPEIAAATGMTHGSVRVNLTRGMKLLRERLAREGLS